MALRPWRASSFGRDARLSALRGGVRYGVRPALAAYGRYRIALRLLAPSARALVPGGRGSAPPERAVCETAPAGTAPAKTGSLRHCHGRSARISGPEPSVRPAIKTPLDGAPQRTRCDQDKCGFKRGDKHRFFGTHFRHGRT